jgi:hypothetical protein
VEDASQKVALTGSRTPTAVRERTRPPRWRGIELWEDPRFAHRCATLFRRLQADLGLILADLGADQADFLALPFEGGAEEEEGEEERLYLQLETRERVQTNEARSKHRRASPT